MTSTLKDFSKIIVNHHRFRFRGPKGQCFTTGKDYEIVDIDNHYHTLHTIDDLGHKHSLSLVYFNKNCQLIDVPCEILELLDDLEDAIINRDIDSFKGLAATIHEELIKITLIQEKDISEGSHFESPLQYVKVVMFDGKWCLLRQPKQIRTHSPMLESYDTKQDLLQKLNSKNYKKIEK